MTSPVRLDIDDRGVATVTIDRPEKRNALSTDVLAALIDAFREVDANPEARVAILTGAGDKAFSAGGDLDKFRQEQEAGSTAQAGRFVELFETMGMLSVPVIGRLNGHCLAGAFGVALGCDMLISVEDAYLGTPEILVGLWPMMIGALMYRNVPRKLANELIMTGRRLTAAEAVEAGIVNRAVPRAELDEAVEAIVGTLIKHPRGIVRMGRQAMFLQQDMPFLEALRFLQQRLGDVLATDDAAEGIAAFLDKRKPEFTGT